MIKLPTLPEFICDAITRYRLGTKSYSSYVKHPHFDSLYLRYGDVCIVDAGTRYIVLTITIANVTAKKRNRGYFTKFINALKDLGINVLVESVLNERLVEFLKLNGFKRVQDSKDYFKNNELT